MLNKLQTYFPTAISRNSPPDSTLDTFYWFRDEGTNPFWLGVPKTDMSAEQLGLLQALFENVDSGKPIHSTGVEKQWQDFLFYSGAVPTFSDRGIRIIQFQINTTDSDKKEFEVALKEFFYDCTAFIWLDQNGGIIIEDKAKLVYEEEDFVSIATTLENDFFIRTSFYIGKIRIDPMEIRNSFTLERKLFTEVNALHIKEQAYTYEKVFPILIAAQLSPTLSALLETDVIGIFREDHEWMMTMRVFLEHSSNVTLAAKSLYIHRNTLQYRIDKFTERTGINVKDFSGAITVYLASLIAENAK